MTALMLIFLLIVVMTLSFALREDRLAEVELETFNIVLDELHEDLRVAFADRHDEWGIRIQGDLTVKFENSSILFDQDSSVIKDEFKAILDKFIPEYLSIIGRKEYRENIKEVRIEGHTAAESRMHDTYIKTVQLSQDRSRNILEHILRNAYFVDLDPEEREGVKFLLSANGLGNGRAVDENGDFVYKSKEQISPDSRRVEFKIVTDSDELVKRLVAVQRR